VPRGCVALQGAALCWVYSRHCFLRDLPANVSQKFPKKLEVVGISDNPPEYLTISCERLKNFAQLIAFRSQYHTRPNGSASEIRVDTTMLGIACILNEQR
jgi:hypothetical protein